MENLIRALQTGSSRSKMEAAIAVRSLATSESIYQVAFVSCGGIQPLIELLTYEAGELHWPCDMQLKATITVRAEAALALASLAVSKDEFREAIGAAGAIPFLCNLLHEHIFEPSAACWQHDLAPFLVLARDAGTGALSCLVKNEANKDRIIAAQAVPVLIQIFDSGTTFGRAAAANVLSKLAAGENSCNKLMMGDGGAIPASLKLIQQGSSKAREIAAEATCLSLNCSSKVKELEAGGLACLSEMLEKGSKTEKNAACLAVNMVNSAVQMKDYILDTFDKNHLLDELNSVAYTPICHPNADLLKHWKAEGIQDKADEIQLLGHSANTALMSAAMQTHHCSKIDLGTSSLQSIIGQQLTQTDDKDGICDPVQRTEGAKRLKVCNSKYPRGCRVIESYSDRETLLRQLVVQESKDNMEMLFPRSETERFLGIFDCLESIPIGYTDEHALGTWQEGLMDESTPTQKFEGSSLASYSGISDLVNALSSHSMGAQEFSALALMFLASQGGCEIKTAIAEAGALPHLLGLIENSCSPSIRESAASAIALLVSFHPINQAAVLKAGGIKTLIHMSKWASRVTDERLSAGNLTSRLQAAAVTAILNLFEASDRHIADMKLRDALPILPHMLGSGNGLEVRASVGSLHILFNAFNIQAEKRQGSETSVVDFLPADMVVTLLDITQGQSQEAREVALEALAELRESPCELREKEDSQIAVDVDELANLRKYGLRCLFLLLESSKVSATITDDVPGVLCSIITNDTLSSLLDETELTFHLMRLLKEGPSLETRVMAAAAVANMGARNKKLQAISKDNIYFISSLLRDDLKLFQTREQPTGKNELQLGSYAPILDQHTGWCLCAISNEQYLAYSLLREHVTAILVYTALSGEETKCHIIAAGAAPTLVQLLKHCCAIPESDLPRSGDLDIIYSIAMPSIHLATQEFAMMALILLSDKNNYVAEKIVQAGAIPCFIKMLTYRSEDGRLESTLCEIAAAALLTMAGCTVGRKAMVEVGAVASLVYFLKSEHSQLISSLSAIAATAQVLGILALDCQEAKNQISKAGGIGCLVEVLIGGGCFAWAAWGQDCAGLAGSVALVQESVSASLANLVLDCPVNSEEAVKAGAIEPLVQLLGIPPSQKEIEGAIYIQINKKADEVLSCPTVEGSCLEASYEELHKQMQCIPHPLTEVVNVGASLAAMAALRNILSSYPPSKQEIIDTGGLTRLIRLLQGWTHPLAEETCISHVSIEKACQIQLQESAAFIIGLLMTLDPSIQEAPHDMPNLLKFEINEKKTKGT
ncbi:hypothetical protein O6H91_12G056900 [Diphasiastrum complanatum]|uniref:Uncharacterized protein n=1 Tax=Diphasiastrum complanatum TaxID=34168 RepID=A0ACC2C263_DIPCM|nr:hypothetical protein O6H91_12G056900 [Diphasiastrum complanatum]